MREGLEFGKICLAERWCVCTLKGEKSILISFQNVGSQPQNPGVIKENSFWKNW
jgi:hypothetical protein